MRTARRSLGLSAGVLAGILVGIVALSAPAAQGQPQNQAPAPTLLRPPSSGGTTSEPPKYRMYLTVVVIGGLLIGANAIPSKRGHQD